MAAVTSMGGSPSERGAGRSRNRWQRTFGPLRVLLSFSLLTYGAACLGVTTYAYDSALRLSSVSYADNTQIRYGYDAAGNIVSRTVGKVGDPVGSLDVDASGAPSSTMRSPMACSSSVTCLA